jgi:plasmid stabilization system protein ParE
MTLFLAYRHEARDDIDEAYAWYEQQKAGLGERFLSALRDVLDAIAANPDHCGVVHRDVRASTLRRFPYVVYYRVETARVLILAVQHGRRDPRRWQSRA